MARKGGLKRWPKWTYSVVGEGKVLSSRHFTPVMSGLDMVPKATY